MNTNFTAHIGAKITEFMARMRQVQNTIRTTASDVHVDVGADISEFNRRMAEIRARIAAIAREKVIIKIEARIEEFQNKINRIATNIRAFGELMQHTLAGSMMAVFPAIAPLIANVGVAIANLGPMIGTVAGSTFALVGAFASAGAAAVAFGAVAIPTIKKLFDEEAKLNAEQKKAKASFDAFKNTYDGLVKVTEKPVLSAFTKAMTIADTLLKSLEPLFISSAQAVDNLMTSLGKSIGTPPVQAFLEYLNTTGGPMLETFGRSFGNVFKGIGSMLVAFAPLSASTAKGFEDMTARFAEWANGLSASSKFQSFIDYVATNMPKIRAIFRDAGAGLVYFFSAFADSSSGMMDGLADMMARFKEWSKTLSENQGFQQFLSYVQQTAPSVMNLIGNLTTFLVNLGIGMAPLGAAILVVVNKMLEFANSAMEGNRSIGIIIAGLVSFGGILLAVVPNIIAFRELFKGLGPLIMKSLGTTFKFITPLFTNFSGVVAKVVALLPKFGAALGLITSPAALIIAAIAGLTAVFVALYNTNETFRAQVQTVWSAIQTAISTAVTAVKDLVMSVWSQITLFWNQNQESIKATASTVWNAIGNVVTSVMTAIGAIMQFVWPVVKALIVSTWNAIQNVIQGATNVILGIIKTFSSLFQGDWKGVWEGIKQILSGALQAVWGAINLYFVGKLLGPLKGFASAGKSIMQTAWAAIKGIFTNTLNTIKTFVTTIFNSIKSSISSVMNSIKSTISSVWNVIKSTITTILNVIKTAISSAWSAYQTIIYRTLNAIKSIVSSVWNAIKATITTVLNGIKAVITAIWNGIKSFISSVLNGIKSVITSTWNAIKNIVSTTMEGVKKAIVDGWNAAKSFLENISLVEIGKNIIQGLVNGIGSMMDSLKNKIAEMANLIPEWAKKILGIHSPSRVMRELGKWVGIGLAEGVSDTERKVAKTVEDLGYLLIDVAENNINQEREIRKKADAEILKLRKDAADKIAALEKKSSDKILTIQETAASRKKGMTAAQQRNIVNSRTETADKIVKIEEETAAKIAQINAKATSDTVKMISTNQKQILEEIKLFVEDKKSLEEMSILEEIAIWEKATNLFEQGTKEKVEAQKKYAAALDVVNKEVASVNEKYTKEMMRINEDFQKEEKRLTDQYEKSLEDRTKALHNFAGTFDEFDVKTEKSGTELLKNLSSQVDGFKKWQIEIEKLAKRAIDDGLIRELTEMGPKALSELIALNSLTDDQLTDYSNLYREKSELARTQAEKELIGMKDDTQKQIEELRNVATRELSKLESDWTNEIRSITSVTATELSTLEQIGVDAVTGLLNGLSSMEGPLKEKATEIANSVADSMKSELDIHSPSRVMKEIGQFIVDGLIAGIKDKGSEASGEAQALAKQIAETFNKNGVIDTSKLIKVDSDKQVAELATLYNQIQDLTKKMNGMSVESINERFEESKEGLKDLLPYYVSRLKELGKVEGELTDERFSELRKEWKFNFLGAYELYEAKLKGFKDVQKGELELLEEFQKEKIEAEKKFVEQSKKLNLLSYKDEMKLYNDFAEQYAKDSEEYKYYENLKEVAKKEVTEKMSKINDEYTKKIQDANQSLIDSEKKLNDEYEKVFNDRVDKILGSASPFDAFNKKTEVTGQQLIDNLKSQIDAINSYGDVMASLSSRVKDEDLLNYLSSLGTGSLAELEALNSLSDAELAKYTELYNERFSAAKDLATEELSGLRENTDEQILLLREETAKQLEMYQDEWSQAIGVITGDVTGQFETLANDMPEVGSNVIEGLQQGLANMTPALLAQAAAIAESIKSTIQGALDIHSPSRWADKFIGRNFVQGIINGFAAMQSDAVKAAAELAEWVKPAIDVSDIINDISGAIDAFQTEIEHKVKVNVEIDGQAGNGGNGGGVHQEVHLHSPKHLSPSENARQLKRVAQQLAYE